MPRVNFERERSEREGYYRRLVRIGVERQVARVLVFQVQSIHAIRRYVKDILDTHKRRGAKWAKRKAEDIAIAIVQFKPEEISP